MLGVFVLLLSLTPLVATVPHSGAPRVFCKHCCDHLEPEEGSGDLAPLVEFNHVPEVRTYINMTILKGSKKKKKKETTKKQKTSD